MAESSSGDQSTYEVAILGAGAAGLSAAAVLGRCGRRVIVVGQPDRENSAAADVHNLPYAEGISPAQLYAQMERELLQHDVVQITDTVMTAALDDERRHVVLSTPSRQVIASRLLIANGIRHEVPAWVPNESWGKSVFICPFCHAYEHRGEDFLVVGPPAPRTLEFALLCQPHARSLTVLMPGPDAATGPLADRIRSTNGRVIADTVATASALNSGELAVVTTGGEKITVGAVALFGITRMRSEFSEGLGLLADTFGIPEVDEDGRASHPLVWVAGTAAKPHFILVEAMGSGLRAGMSIHQDLVLTNTIA